MNYIHESFIPKEIRVKERNKMQDGNGSPPTFPLTRNENLVWLPWESAYPFCYHWWCSPVPEGEVLPDFVALDNFICQIHWLQWRLLLFTITSHTNRQDRKLRGRQGTRQMKGKGILSASWAATALLKAEACYLLHPSIIHSPSLFPSTLLSTYLPTYSPIIPEILVYQFDLSPISNEVGPHQRPPTYAWHFVFVLL